MDVSSFQRIYVAELLELRSIEEQLAPALLRMVSMANHPNLEEAFLAHHEETGSQRDRLDQLLRGHSHAATREHRDGSMQAIIAEGERWADLVEDRDLRDARLIASAQRIEHHEIAVYGTLAAWAK